VLLGKEATMVSSAAPVDRRHLLAMIGTATNAAVMYQAMTSLGHAAESDFQGPVELAGDPKGASVIVLGAGLAGMTAALELRKAGYKVRILEYRDRAGGRCWSLRGGDTYTELGGLAQQCAFDPGLYINPGPWRIPYHHRALLHYCKQLGVTLEPFVEYNANSFLHDSKAFGGKPQRFRHVMADFNGYVSELLSKAVDQGKLDQEVTREDREILLESLRSWGALDKTFSYTAATASAMRGYDKDMGGGPDGAPLPSTPIAREDILRSGLWSYLSFPLSYEYAQTMFQPVGGMDMIAQAFAREVGSLIQHNVKVTEIAQSDGGVTVTYEDAAAGGASRQATADWCVCTIPASILSQIKNNFSSPLQAAISALPYAPAAKIGLQFKRRFWEEDEAIYGGISFTDLPIGQISYPSTDYQKPGKGVLLGGYVFGVSGVEFTAMPPAERVRRAVEYGTQIHPQMREEFDNGVAVAWHRVPWTLGCYGMWNEDTRRQHYQNLCAIDGRTVLAGEHCSYVNAWQEGAILSSLSAIDRLHERVIAGG
jgi:monoamine oxidase